MPLVAQATSKTFGTGLFPHMLLSHTLATVAHICKFQFSYIVQLCCKAEWKLSSFLAGGSDGGIFNHLQVSLTILSQPISSACYIYHRLFGLVMLHTVACLLSVRDLGCYCDKGALHLLLLHIFMRALLFYSRKNSGALS